MEEFVLEIEKPYNRIMPKEMDLPQVVLAFKLLSASKLPYQDRKLVLTGMTPE